MKASELRSKNVDELNKELLDLLKAQFGLRMQIATQQLSNNSQIGKVRRDIARVRTLPVSYTHLDVYKRQRLLSSLKSASCSVAR